MRPCSWKYLEYGRCLVGSEEIWNLLRWAALSLCPTTFCSSFLPSLHSSYYFFVFVFLLLLSLSLISGLLFFSFCSYSHPPSPQPPTSPTLPIPTPPTPLLPPPPPTQSRVYVFQISQGPGVLFCFVLGVLLLLSLLSQEAFRAGVSKLLL